jgi:hypothetical protein
VRGGSQVGGDAGGIIDGSLALCAGLKVSFELTRLLGFQ